VLSIAYEFYVCFMDLLVVWWYSLTFLTCRLAVVLQLKESICEAHAHAKVKAIVIRDE
jgi:hypothetical protein